MVVSVGFVVVRGKESGWKFVIHSFGVLGCVGVRCWAHDSEE